MDDRHFRDASSGRVEDSRAQRLKYARGRVGGSWPVVEPLIVIVIGIALGLVDQTSSEVSGMFRIPALVAALLLVGQGLTLLEDARSVRPVEEDVEEREFVPVGVPDPTTLPANAPTGGARPIIIAGSAEEGAEESRTPTRAYVVLGLAIWLGVATLISPTAPLSLILLSLLSAFLLFARGWRTLSVGNAPE